LRLTVEELLEIDSAREAAISPDGCLVAFRMVAAAVPGGPDQVRVVSVAEGKEVDLHAVAGGSPAFSPTGEEVAYVAETATVGEAEIRMLSLLDGSTRRLATVAGRPSLPTFAPDGSRVAFVVTPASGASVLSVVAAGTGAVARIGAAPGEAIVAPSWSPDGAMIAFGRTRAGRGEVGPTSSIEIWDIARGSKRHVETGCAYATCPSWSPDGRTLAFVGVVEPRLGAADPALSPWLVGVGGGVARPVGKVEGVLLEPTPSAPVWSADGKALYMRLGNAGAIDLVRLDHASGAVTSLLGGCQVLDFAANRHGVVACTVIAPDDPGSIHVITAGPRPVEHSVGGWARVRGPAISLPEHRTFALEGGGERDGWVAGLDPRRAPQPTLLAFHGGPHGFFGPGFQGGHFHRVVLASRGWAVLTVNSIGSGTYGRGFADGLRGAWGERDLPEQLAALDELVAAGLADPARLAVCGYSYGGYLAAWAIARDARFAAAVVGAPIVDLESFEMTSDIGSWYTPWQMNGGLPENLERYRRLSPVAHVAAVTTPTLILHGEADRRVPVAQGELLRDRLMVAGGADVEFVSYPGADHRFYAAGEPADRLDFNRRIVEWLEAKVNGGGERGRV
jgi:dipeptidyl aminopeptidase/acylaminoacyl peptidase